MTPVEEAAFWLCEQQTWNLLTAGKITTDEAIGLMLEVPKEAMRGSLESVNGRPFAPKKARGPYTPEQVERRRKNWRDRWQRKKQDPEWLERRKRRKRELYARKVAASKASET